MTMTEIIGLTLLQSYSIIIHVTERCPSGRKVRHWKCRVGQPTMGSNPILSAISTISAPQKRGYCCFLGMGCVLA